MFIDKKLGGNRIMNQAILATKPNPENVKELLKRSYNHNDDTTIQKVRIYDDPGEIIRYKNKQARHRTNEVYTEEYFKNFH